MTPQENGIKWTDFTANPIKYRDQNGKSVWACVKVSDGCKNCYAETLAHRYGRGGPFILPQTKKVTTYFDEKEANSLLKSTKISGKRIFIGDMTDVFGPWVSFDILDQLFAVFALRPDVTFQVLTKRPERMAEWLDSRALAVCRAIAQMRPASPETQTAWQVRQGQLWPLSNVWLGTSVENQLAADERIPHLLKCPASALFLSCEPLLGSVDLEKFSAHSQVPQAIPLDWIIVGGESGPGARPCNLEWIHSIVRQCEAAGVACFVKQLGKYPVWNHLVPGCSVREALEPLDLKDPKGGDINEFPADLRVRQFPQTLPHCPGCTGRRRESTHFEGTIEHPKGVV